MSHIQWLSAEWDLERSRADRQATVAQAGFEGMLGSISTTVVTASTKAEAAAPFDCRTMIEEVAARIADSGAEISLQWDTPELGSLQIEISRDGDQVQVTLTTDDANAADVLQRHATLLGELLAEDGLQLARLTVLPSVTRRLDIDSERNDSESEINSLLGVIRRASSS